MPIRRSISPAQLKALQKKIKTLIPGFQTLGQHVVITDAEANILYMNKVAEQTTGYTLKEALGKNPGDLWGGNMPLEFYVDMWETVKKTKRPFIGEIQNTRKDKTNYWQEILISPVLDKSGNVQLLIAIEPDVTERKESQEFLDTLSHQLTQAKQFSQALHETIKLICQYTAWVYGEVWVIDKNTHLLRQDFSWNAQPKKLGSFVQHSKQLTFASGQGLPGRVWRSKKPEWIMDVSREPKKIFLRVEQAQQVGLKAAFAQPIVVNKAVVAVLVFFMLEARKKDEQLVGFVQSAIQKLEFMFQQKFFEDHLNILGQSVESSKDAILVAGKDGDILYVNSAWESLVGRPREKVLGEKIQIAWDHGMPKEFFDEMWETVLKKRKPYSQEVRLVSKNKSECWQEIHVSPINDKAGKVQFIIAVASDTSKRKAKDKFREEFISIIGHQLKNPLTSTRWTLELLLDQKKINRSQKKDLEVLYKQNNNILNLVGDLLVLSRVEKTQIDRVKLDLVKEINAIIAVTKANHPFISFTFKHQKPVQLLGNKTLALQVFHNIIMNAAEYSDQKKGKVQIQLEVKNGKCTFICKDNGIGIPKAEQPKVFTQFFRGSNAETIKEGGTGLGLFIVKLITEALRWKVYFESKENSGTTFFVTFPLH